MLTSSILPCWFGSFYGFVDTYNLRCSLDSHYEIHFFSCGVGDNMAGAPQTFGRHAIEYIGDLA